MVSKSSLPWLGDAGSDDIEGPRDPADGVESNRHSPEDIDPVPFDSADPKDDLADSFVERVQAQPMYYILRGIVVFTVGIAFFLFIFPFFPSLSDPNFYGPLLTLGVAVAIFLWGKKSERERFKNFGFYVDSSDAFFGEFDRTKKRFTPIRGFSYRGFLTNYLRVGDVEPEIANRYNKDVEPDDMAKIRLDDDIVHIVGVPFFDSVAVAFSPSLEEDPFGADTTLRPEFPEMASVDMMERLKGRLESQSKDIDELQRDLERKEAQLRQTEQELKSIRKDLRDEDKKYITEVLESLPNFGSGGTGRQPSMNLTNQDDE